MSEDRTRILQTSLEELDDPYPALRQAWCDGAPGTFIRVKYGVRKPRLRSRDVAGLLRLTGFDPFPSQRLARGRQMEAAWSDRPRRSLSCSVVVPCKNEVGNVRALVNRLPPVGSSTELIFVDGSSDDGTPQEIEAIIAEHPDRQIRLIHQQGGGGKAAAVFTGFDVASGDVLMILDADMTVPPEDLPRFCAALAEGHGKFANGTRFVFGMDGGAMAAANNVGNRIFSHFLSWLLGARVTDTLCGTKALFKSDWPAVRDARPLFGGHDPWGDFDLLLGAAHAGLSIVEVPIRYRARMAGESKMQPLRGGVALLKTCLAGVRQLKTERRRSESA